MLTRARHEPSRKRAETRPDVGARHDDAMTSDGAAPTTPNEDELALREPLVGGATAIESGYDSDVDVPADASASVPEARREEEPTTPATPPRRVNFRGFTARTQSLYLGTERTLSTQTTDSGAPEDAVESLDFADVDSHWARRARGRGVFSKVSAKWVVAAFIGVGVGTIAFLIDVSVLYAYRGRGKLFEVCRRRVHLALAMFAYGGVGVALAAIAGALTTYVAPRAKGAGVHYVMAMLNGIYIPKAFDASTLWVKAVATIAAVSSGLMIGPEGPLVHVGAAIAMQFTHGASSGMADLFQSDLDRSDFISAGAAAGIAAAFGAPIGGVLFSLEEASTFWRESTTRRALFSASIATFVLALARAVFLEGSAASEHTQMKNPGLLRVGDFDSTYFLIELPFYAALAGTCGVISGIVTKSIIFVSTNYTPQRNERRLAQVVLVSLACIVMFFGVAAAGKCVTETPGEVSRWSEASIRLWCAEGEYADVGSILLGNKNDVIAWVLGSPAKAHTLHALLLSFATTLISLIMAANLFLPAGLFMPTILWGSLLGRAAAIVVEHSLSPLGDLRVNPHAYALVGATAALAGTFRATISVVIIVLEGVGKSAFLFPLLIAVAGANLASRLFGASLYEEQLVRSKIPFLHAKPPKALLDDSITAFDVCARDVVAFKAIEKVSAIEEALAQTTHNGFPILSAKGKRVIGVILRKQLLVLLSRRAFVENLVHAPVLNSSAMEEGHDDDSVLGGRTPDDVVSLRVAEYCAELTRVMRGFHHRSSSSRHGRRAESSIIARLGLTDVERERRCDLGVFMALSPASIAADARARDAYVLFTRLSLRHLCVVDAATGAIRGIITRHDLFDAAESVDRSLHHSVSSSSILL